MNDSIKKPMDILKHLLPSKILADDLKLIEDKLNVVINDLDWCVDALVRAFDKLYQSDIKSFSIVNLLEEIEDNLTARQLIKEETLDEIRNRSIDLCGKKAKESQDKEVEKVE